MYINTEKGTASGSLRAPSYFSIIDMIHHESIKPLLLRSGGHQQAGGLTIKTQDIDKLITALQNYADTIVVPSMLEKEITIDTVITPQDLDDSRLLEITKLAPFGEGNPEPLFIIKNATLTNTSSVGKKAKKHLKCEITHGNHTLTAMYRGKGELHDTLSTTVDVIGRVKPDTYK